jgi:hypothetical protein
LPTIIAYKTLKEESKNRLINKINERRAAENDDEKLVQSFFEEVPFACLSILSSVDSEHQIFGNVIISQPYLLSYDGTRKLDFLIVTLNSLNLSSSLNSQ